jgi:hypothetical protein
MTPKKDPDSAFVKRLFSWVCAVLLPLLLLGCKVSDDAEDLKHNILVGSACGVLFVLTVLARAGLTPKNKDGLLALLVLVLAVVVIVVIVA